MHKASLCPGREQLLSKISPDIMVTIYNEILIPFGQKQSDQFKNRLATEVHPDPFGSADFTQQKWLSSDIMNIYGMYLRDLSRKLSGPDVYHVGPYARNLYLKNRRNYVEEYIKPTHTEQQYSEFMPVNYEHSIQAGIEVAGDPYDKDLIIMFSNETSTHWYLTILDKRPDKMCVVHFDSGSIPRNGLKTRCSFLIQFINDFRAHVKSINTP